MVTLAAVALAFGFNQAGPPPPVFESRGHNPRAYVQGGALRNVIEWQDGRLQRQDGVQLSHRLRPPLTVTARVRVDPRPGAIGAVYLLDWRAENGAPGEGVKEVDLIETHNAPGQASAAIHSSQRTGVTHSGRWGTRWRTVSAQVDRAGVASIFWDGRLVARGHAGRGGYRLIANVWGVNWDGWDFNGWAARVPPGFTGAATFSVTWLEVRAR